MPPRPPAKSLRVRLDFVIEFLEGAQPKLTFDTVARMSNLLYAALHDALPRLRAKHIVNGPDIEVTVSRLTGEPWRKPDDE